MTNREWICSLVQRAAEEITGGKLAETMLLAARSDLNESGWLYELWCDGQGRCGNGDSMCSDEAQMSCILRFLDIPFSGV